MEWNYTEDKNYNDSSGDETEDPLGFDDLFIVHVALTVVSFGLIFCGICENVGICWILIRTKKCLKSFSNFHLLNLAITDILFRIISTPDLLTDHLPGGSDVKCKVAEFGKYMTLAVTFSLLAGIAFDRYMHIVHPLRARRITWKQSRNFVVASWIYGAVCSAPFLYSTQRHVHIDEETLEKFGFCYDAPGLPFQISLTVFLGCSFLIPLLFMGIAYGKILRVLWKRARIKLTNSPVAKAKIRAVKMMAAGRSYVFYYVGPYLTWQTVDAFLYNDKLIFEETENEVDDSDLGSDDLEKQLRQEEKTFMTYLLINNVFSTMTFASSVLNPLIFGYYNRSFKEEVKKSFCGNKCGQCVKKRKQDVCPYLERRGIFTLGLIDAKETNLQTTSL